MKESDAILRISKKLQKQEHMYKGYAKGSISLKCLCDNLALRVMKEIDDIGMLPPEEHVREIDVGGGKIIEDVFCEWEPEDE